MTTKAQVTGRNKHFELKQHFIRELVAAKIVSLAEVSTANQIADIFTKPLVRPTFEKHRSMLLNGLPGSQLAAPGSQLANQKAGKL